MRDGQKIRIPGKGKPGRNGGKNGDLYLQINVAEDPKFSLRKRDIIMDLPITVGQAVAGAKVTAQDIDGNEVTFKVPAGSSSGTEVRISGRGVANRQGDGDLIGRVQIRIPDKPSLKVKRRRNSTRSAAISLTNLPRSADCHGTRIPDLPSPCGAAGQNAVRHVRNGDRGRQGRSGRGG